MTEFGVIDKELRATPAVTVKLQVLEVCPSGLLMSTVQVPASLALLNEWLNWLLETKVGGRR